MGWANQGSKHVSSGLHSLCFSPWLDFFWWGTAPKRWKKPSVPSWCPLWCLSQQSEADKGSHLSSVSLASLYHLSLTHQSITFTYPPPYHCLSSLPFTCHISQSPITDCYQLLSIFYQYGSPAHRLWSCTCHLPSSTCASSFSWPVLLSQPFAVKMRSLWTIHLVTFCFPSTVRPNHPPTPSLHCLCRVRAHLFSQLSPGCWGLPLIFQDLWRTQQWGSVFLIFKRICHSELLAVRN